MFNITQRSGGDMDWGGLNITSAAVSLRTAASEACPGYGLRLLPWPKRVLMNSRSNTKQVSSGVAYAGTSSGSDLWTGSW
jgi:hypothetical protein